MGGGRKAYSDCFNANRKQFTADADGASKQATKLKN